jgi:hypothetical protein
MLSIRKQRKLLAGSLAWLGKQKFKWNPMKVTPLNRNKNGMKESSRKEA